MPEGKQHPLTLLRALTQEGLQSITCKESRNPVLQALSSAVLAKKQSQLFYLQTIGPGLFTSTKKREIFHLANNLVNAYSISRPPRKQVKFYDLLPFL